MYYIEKKQDNIQFLSIFIICLLLHLALILFLPSFYSYMPSIKESKEEQIRAGLVSFIKSEEKKVADIPKEEKKVEEQIVKESIEEVKAPKELSPKIEEKVQKTSAPKEVEVPREKIELVVEEQQSKAPLLAPSRPDRSIDNTQVLRTNVSRDNLRERNISQANISPVNIREDRELRGSNTSQITASQRELINIDTNVNISVPENIKIEGNLARMNVELSNEFESIINIKGSDINTQLPSNMSARSLDVEGGRVDFINYVAPVYPQEALERAQSGRVEAEFEIRGSHTIFRGITLKSGFPRIDRAVEEAAREWRLKIEKDGLLVNGRVSVRVDFGLRARN